MTIISPQTRFLLSLSKLKGVGPAALKKVAAIPQFDSWSIEKLATAVPQVARSLEGEVNWDESQDWAHAQIQSAERHQARILSPLDPDYPALLAQTKDDPFILYVQGTLAAPGQRCVAVIGTREPTAHGAVVAKRITTQFGKAGWSVISGLALGCDALAHQAALDCGAHTVAVMAHGLQMIAPSKNKQLAQAILDAGGALVSEYPFGQTVQNQQYVKRDRTQAGMALGVVMIQSDIKGGSLYASRACLDYGRWLAVPYPTDRDLDSRAPKVQANVVIANAPAHERANLLRCTTSALSRVIILRNREDSILLTESDGVRAFEGLSERSVYSNETDLLTSTPAEVSPSASNGFSRDLLLDEPAKHDGLAEGTPDHWEETAAETSEAGGIPSEPSLQPKPVEAPEAEDSLAKASPDEQSLEAQNSPSEAPPTIEAKTHTDDQNTKVTRQLPLVLTLVLHKGSDPSPAFGLWDPPKVSSKEFKTRLGNARENLGVREFYARHKRLQSHLAKLQRKLADAAKPLSHDKLLDLRLDGEEVILHLAQLARSSANIDALATELHLRDEAEDWIKRDYAEQRSTGRDVSCTSESRHRLVEELAILLKTDLRSFVIDDGHSDAARTTVNGEFRQVALLQLIERLNAVLKAAFREDFGENS
ncbi:MULTISPECIES: DNA-processing protein DprA [Achromobacter]|uniref:DNA-processing protein DprA n=1 Tax=Achromobacter TaxID=222 RepID=UPI0025B7B06F|nr:MULTISPECIES: DNA-processing protein DprA [Achromobacter]